ncbi:MAG: hypothetical protein HKN82_20475 [Akkermansiaceae bacterium]|nr:hypothetical protein [Akkermansiaceae bacterium]NNM30876.1 hypothetical protein [Akkermansiaceae bacterium]
MKVQLLIPSVLIAFLLVLPGAGQEGKGPPPEAAGEEVDPFAVAPHGVPGKKDLAQRRAELPSLIQVQVEWIEMSHEALTKLMFTRDPKGDSTALRLEVQKLVTDGDAEILETSIALTRSGQRAAVQSGPEHIYPTEYAAPEVPNHVEIDLGSGKADTAAISHLATPPTPTAFETRHAGTNLEIEPTMDHLGRLIDLRISAEIVEHTGDSEWQTMKTSLGTENKVRMPSFSTLRLNAGLTMRDGQYRFAGVHSPWTDDGKSDRTRKVMIFVRCDIAAIGEEDLEVH